MTLIKIYKANDAYKWLSNRSKTPPCPGNNVPKSLIQYSRFIEEATKSPNWATAATTKLIMAKTIT